MILRERRRRFDAHDLRVRREVPIVGERERRRHLDDEPRTIDRILAAPGADRRSDDRLEPAAHLVVERRLKVHEATVGERGERPAVRLERVVAVRVVAGLPHAVDRAEGLRHHPLDDAQDRAEIVVERNAEPRRLGRRRRRQREFRIRPARVKRHAGRGRTRQGGETRRKGKGEKRKGESDRPRRRPAHTTIQ